MRITLLEMSARWGDPMGALDQVEARLSAGATTDLVLLPEASLCGYVTRKPNGDLDFDLTPFAEPIDGPTAVRCAAIAAARSIHLVAPLVLREGKDLYNAMACFAPDGTLPIIYKKHHPWIPETWATPGPSVAPVVTICGRDLTIAICYDLHFLPDEAEEELRVAELLLFPSAWVENPDRRIARLSQLARQFQLTIASANWAPGVVSVYGQGSSCIIAPDGQLLAVAPLGGRIDFTLPPRP